VENPDKVEAKIAMAPSKTKQRGIMTVEARSIPRRTPNETTSPATVLADNR
jgi:hypothetical protein